jgi:hypothetical protein
MGERYGADQAYEALSQHPHLLELVELARALMSRAVDDKRTDRAPDPTGEVAAKQGLKREDSATPLGNVVEVLAHGANNDSESALICALAAHVVARNPPQSGEEQERAANDLLWLAANTPFDATGLLDRALGDRAAALWTALADRIRQVDEGRGGALGRGEALVGAVALASSTSSAAIDQAAALATKAHDPKLARVLGGSRAALGTGRPVVGEIAPTPLGPVVTTLLAFTGVLFLWHAARAFGKLALAYKRPAEILLSSDGGIRVRWRIELLGRTLRDRDVLVPRAGLAEATREVRYPRLALYAGLLALAVGSYAGVAAFVDGVRAESPSLLVTGLVIVILGVAADFLLTSLVPGVRGRCRVLFVPRSGRRLCVGDVDVQAADAILGRLAH